MKKQKDQGSPEPFDIEHEVRRLNPDGSYTVEVMIGQYKTTTSVPMSWPSDLDVDVSATLNWRSDIDLPTGATTLTSEERLKAMKELLQTKYSEDVMWSWRQRVRHAQRPPPSTAKIEAVTDWFPSPKTRKLLRKLVADQAEHMTELAAKGRHRSARWTWLCTWALLLWYGPIHLIRSVMSAVRGRRAS
jgi:hypothetical protein